MICWRQIRDLGREGGNAMELAYAEQNQCAQKENTLNYSISKIVIYTKEKVESNMGPLVSPFFDGSSWKQEEKKRLSGGFFTYSMKQRWHWRAVASFDITKGEHILSVFGKKSCLRIDRIYVTNKREWPPVDADWQPTKRI